MTDGTHRTDATVGDGDARNAPTRPPAPPRRRRRHAAASTRVVSAGVATSATLGLVAYLGATRAPDAAAGAPVDGPPTTVVVVRRIHVLPDGTAPDTATGFAPTPAARVPEPSPVPAARARSRAS